MSTLTDRVDKFVRWFFNSSPQANLAQPATMTFGSSESTWLRHGAIGGAGLAAIAMLLIFYSVVAGAVERGASRHAELGARPGSVAVSPMAANGKSIRIARASD